MLKTNGLSDVSRPKVKNSNGEIVEFSINGSGKEFTKKIKKIV